MWRRRAKAREGWEDRCEADNFTFHTHQPEGTAYWKEGAYYEFSAEAIGQIEQATVTLHEMCLEAVAHAVERPDVMAKFGIPDQFHGWVRESWDARGESDLHLYGRFDLAYYGQPGEEVKMLEYNADTPTTLLEASRVQARWAAERFPKAGHFNALEGLLVARWGVIFDKVDIEGGVVHFACVKNSEEDFRTVQCMESFARAALEARGIDDVTTRLLFVEDIGWDPDGGCFVDLVGQPIRALFKLYPWEWLVSEDFGEFLVGAHECNSNGDGSDGDGNDGDSDDDSGAPNGARPIPVLIEPVWKLLISNKAILPLLWELFPGHPNLLPAFWAEDGHMEELGSLYIAKPKLGREGANVRIVSTAGPSIRDAIGAAATATTASDAADPVGPSPGVSKPPMWTLFESGGVYGSEGYVYQQLVAPPTPSRFGGNYPVIGSWVVGDSAAGILMREECRLVVNNESACLPHIVTD